MKARRGDIVVVTFTVTTHVLGQGSASVEEHRVGVVTSVTRNDGGGRVKAWRYAGDTHVTTLANTTWRHPSLAILPQNRCDVAAVMAEAEAHHWDGHPGQVKPWDNLAELREALRPHRREA